MGNPLNRETVAGQEFTEASASAPAFVTGEITELTDFVKTAVEDASSEPSPEQARTLLHSKKTSIKKDSQYSKIRKTSIGLKSKPS